LILILNHFKTADFDFDFKSLFRCVILILISNDFTSDLSQHCPTQIYDETMFKLL